MSTPIILVISVAEAEKASYRCCVTHRLFTGDLEGKCSRCNCPIFFRPGPPFSPRKVCPNCMAMIVDEKSFSE